MANVIDLDPELTEALNQHLIEILKLPKELLKLHTTKSHPSEAEQMTLKKAGEAYRSEDFSKAIEHYEEYKKIISLKYNVNIDSNKEKIPWYNIVQYLIAKCLIKSEKCTEMFQAKDILLELENNVGDKYPMVYYARGEFYEKLFAFEEAERTVNKGLAVLNENKNNLINYYVPMTNDKIIESTYKGLSKLLINLKNRSTRWYPCDAVCFMKNCHENSGLHVSGRKIFKLSPAYDGIVRLICDNLDPCNTVFHRECWKVQKKLLSTEREMSDDEFINWQCFTPNCQRSSVPCKIKEIWIPSKYGEVIIKTPKENVKDKVRNSGSKGAKPKTKSTVNQNDSKVPEQSTKSSKNKSKEQEELAKETEELNSRLMKLTCVREKNFNIDKDNNWRPDLKFYGNKEFELNYYDTPLEPYSLNDDKENSRTETFIYSCFYDYISKNAPVKINILGEKWEEITGLIDNVKDKTLYELYGTRYANITEFLLQSDKFCVIGNYICTPKTIPETYELVKNNTCTTLRHLMNIKQSPKKCKNKDLEESILSNIDEKSIEKIINSPFKPKNTEEKSISKSARINNNLLENNERTPSIDETELISEILTNVNNNNISLSSTETPETSYHIEAAKHSLETACLRKQLEEKIEELKTKDIQLLDMKMTMLRNSLESQRALIKTYINNRLYNFQKEHVIISKIQSVMGKKLNIQLPIDENEWIQPINELNYTDRVHLQIYEKKLAEISSKEFCQNIDDVNLHSPFLPEAKYDISELVKNAFESCIGHILLSRGPPVVPNLYPPTFLPNSAFIQNRPFIPPYQSYSMYPQPPPQPQPIPIPIVRPLFPVVQNNFSPHPQPKPDLELIKPNSNLGLHKSKPDLELIKPKSDLKLSKLNSDLELIKPNSNLELSKPKPDLEFIKPKSEWSELNLDLEWSKPNSDSEVCDSVATDNGSQCQSEKLNGFPEEKVKITEQIDKVEIENEQVDGSSESNDENERDQLSDRVNLTKNTKTSADILLDLLRSRNKGVLEYDLLCTVEEVRKSHNNSLTGLKLSKIVHEVEKFLHHREEMQLVNYHQHIIKEVSRRTPSNPSKSRRTSVSSTSSYISTSSTSREPTSGKKKSWNPIDNSVGKWNGTQDECGICCEDLSSSTDQLRATYTLRCNHSFHKKCVKEWFKQDQSCPFCRTHSTIDDEFPPLS